MAAELQKCEAAYCSRGPLAHYAHPPDAEPRASRSQELIAKVCDDLKALLLEKNAMYGDSALNPARIFSKADPVEQIRVRIDDKLSRIRTTGERAADEDTARDLAGYLVLLLVAQEVQKIERVAQAGGR